MAPVPSDDSHLNPWALGAIYLALGLLFTYILTLRGDATKDDADHAAGVLQLLGLVSVFAGLEGRRRHHQVRDPFTLLAEWEGPHFARRWRAYLLGDDRSQPITAKLQAVVGTLSVSVGAAVLHAAAATIEEQVRRLREQIDTLQQGQDDVRRQLAEQVKTLTERIEAEAEERRRRDEELAGQHRRDAVGGLHLEYVGAGWLLLAAIASGWPDWVARHF